MPFPVIKLGSIFLKQLSKPLAAYIKRKAKEHPFLRSYMLIPPAQWYHRIDFRLRMWVAGIKQEENFKVTALTEEKAIEVGAELLGEVVIFGVAAGCLTLEWWRQTRNTQKKEQVNQCNVERLQKEVKDLEDAMQEQSATLNELVRVVEVLQSKHFKVVRVKDSSHVVPSGVGSAVLVPASANQK